MGDTGFFIDFIHRARQNHPAAVAKVLDLEGRNVGITMRAITRFELASGAEQYVDPPRGRRAVRRLLESVPTHPLREDAVHHRGTLQGTLAAKGTPIGALDSLIAATALEVGGPLLTHDVQEFSRIPGLLLEAY